MGREDKKEPFLANLGRATMRGLRRCQKCGTLNGTRGYSCKNKLCDVVFKEAGGKKKSSTEPCKINTGTTAQIYSVRVRDKGPDYRGFVQLPTLHNNGSNMLLNDGFVEPDMMLEGARCFVESCQKLKYSLSPQQSGSPCAHIKSAAQCYKDALPLTLKNSTLNTLPIPAEFKDEMYQLATDTAGPLVQRVSKSLVVVKCKPDSMHPLGFLHFSFIQTKMKKDGERKFYCSCRTFKFHPSTKETYRKCVHLYACIVAFASDERLAVEFGFYVDLIKDKDPVEELCLEMGVPKDELCLDVVVRKEEEDADESENEVEAMEEEEEEEEEVRERSFFILNDSTSGTPCQVEVEVVRGDSDIMDMPISAAENGCSEDDLESKLEIQLQTEEGLHLHTSDGGTISVHQLPDNVSLAGLKRKTDESMVQASSALLTLQKGVAKKVDPRRSPSSLPLKKGGKSESSLDECEVSLSFVSWIASLAEKINQSMHYGLSGKPDPLVFHLPKSFFDCLIERITRSLGSRKRKLAHETQNFIRKEEVPLGKFTKYTWKLTTLAQVKEIFANPEIPLEVVRYFSMQKDGSYKPCKLPQPPPNSELDLQSGSHPIRPREYKTVLRVGIPCPVLPKEPTPFVLEWIPDILPKSQIGELRLKFRFDHYCNGQLVLKQPTTSILVPKTSLKSTATKSLGPPLAPRPPQNKALTPITTTDSLLSIPINTDNLSSGDSITVLTF